MTPISLLRPHSWRDILCGCAAAPSTSVVKKKSSTPSPPPPAQVSHLAVALPDDWTGMPSIEGKEELTERLQVMSVLWDHAASSAESSTPFATACPSLNPDSQRHLLCSPEICDRGVCMLSGRIAVVTVLERGQRHCWLGSCYLVCGCRLSSRRSQLHHPRHLRRRVIDHETAV